MKEGGVHRWKLQMIGVSNKASNLQTTRHAANGNTISFNLKISCQRYIFQSSSPARSYSDSRYLLCRTLGLYRNIRFASFRVYLTQLCLLFVPFNLDRRPVFQETHLGPVSNHDPVSPDSQCTGQGDVGDAVHAQQSLPAPVAAG